MGIRERERERSDQVSEMKMKKSKRNRIIPYENIYIYMFMYLVYSFLPMKFLETVSKVYLQLVSNKNVYRSFIEDLFLLLIIFFNKYLARLEIKL